MKKLIFIAAALILLVVAGVAAWQIYVPIHEDNVSVQTYENLRQFVEPPTPVPTPPPDAPSSLNVTPTPSPIADSAAQPSPQVDFASLRTVNPEIVAWLTIEGTNIDYPVAQHSDNDYYLHYLFNGEYNSSGCLFMDCRNATDVSDRHTIIYGHHMDNGTMLQNLMYYKDQSFYDDHPAARLITPNGSYMVEFFAGYVADVDSNSWEPDFTSDEDFEDWLAAAMERSAFESKAIPSAADRIVTLSTCSYEFYNARFVLLGKLTADQKTANPTITDKQIPSSSKAQAPHTPAQRPRRHSIGGGAPICRPQYCLPPG